MADNVSAANGCSFVATAALALIGLLFAAVFAVGLFFDTRAEKLCCPTLMSCYPCADPPAPPLWPLFVALFFFAASLLLWRLTSQRERE